MTSPAVGCVPLTNFFNTVETRDFGHQSVQASLGRRQQDILFLLNGCPGGLTNDEISERLGWRINTVTPRIKELRELGLVVSGGARLNARTGRPNVFWKTTR